MPKLRPWSEPTPRGVEAAEGSFSPAQPSGILQELLQENARQQQWMTDQAEVFIRSAKQQHQHLEAALELCKLHQDEEPHGHFELTATAGALEASSSEKTSYESKWALQLAASPCPEKIVEGPIEAEESIAWMPTPSKSEREDGEERADPAVPKRIADLIGVKGWARSESSAHVNAISQKLRNDRRTQEDRLQWLVRSKRFDVCVGVLILVNSVFIGFQVEHGEDERYKGGFLVGSIIFCVFFLAEIVLRMLAERLNFLTHDWVWNAFDTLVVISSVVELFLRLLYTDGQGHSSQNMSMFRTVRVLRFVRVARVLRVMRVFRELRMMIFSIMHSLQSIVWAMVLLLVITFIFGITFTQGAQEALRDEAWSQRHDPDRLRRRFGTLDRTMLTLFQAVLGGFSWAGLSDMLLQVHFAYELLFCAFETFTVLALLNVVTGVFVDSAMRSASQDRDLVIQDQMSQDGSYAQELRRLFMEADSDGTGLLELQEFLDYVQDDRVQSYLRALDIHVSEARSLFNLLDIDDSGTVTVDEFITGCLRFKGEAKGVDVLTLMYENKKMVSTIIGALENMGEDIQVLRRNSGQVCGSILSPHQQGFFESTRTLVSQV